MNCTPNFEEIRPLEPDIEQFPCCGINEQRNATRQVDFQLRDNNTTGMCPEQDFRSGAGHLQTPGVACPLPTRFLQRYRGSNENPRDLAGLLRELWDSELVVLMECLEEIVCFPMQKKKQWVYCKTSQSK